MITGAKPIDKSLVVNFEKPPVDNPSDDEDLVDVNDLRLHQKPAAQPEPGVDVGRKVADGLQSSTEFDAYKDWVRELTQTFKLGSFSHHNLLILYNNNITVLQFEKKRELRHQLNSLGLSESWLRNKPNRTAVEESLYQKMLAEKRLYYNELLPDDVSFHIYIY